MLNYAKITYSLIDGKLYVLGNIFIWFFHILMYKSTYTYIDVYNLIPEFLEHLFQTPSVDINFFHNIITDSETYNDTIPIYPQTVSSIECYYICIKNYVLYKCVKIN